MAVAKKAAARKPRPLCRMKVINGLNWEGKKVYRNANGYSRRSCPGFRKLPVSWFDDKYIFVKTTKRKKA